jgi:hypothetical protein
VSDLLSLPTRLLDKIEPEPMSGCWLWTGSLSRDGYAQAATPGRNSTEGVHRTVYKLLVGPIGKPTLDHLCRVRCCVNPRHVRPATRRENLMAPGSTCLAKIEIERTHCPRHPQKPLRQNTRQRVCLECKRDDYRKHREARCAHQREYERSKRQRTEVAS